MLALCAALALGATAAWAAPAARTKPSPAPAPADHDEDLGAWTGDWAGALAFGGDDDFGGGPDREFAPDGRGGAGFHGHGPGAGPRGGRGMGMGRGGGEGMRALDLSAEQQQKMQDIRERTMRRNIQARADLRIARLDLGKLMRAENPDRRAIDAQMDKIGTMRTAMRKAQVGAMLDARALLTEAQRQKLRELRPWRGVRRDGDDGGRGGDGDAER